MIAQKKIKFIIMVAMLIIISLCLIVVAQTINIVKSKKEISNQQQQIQQLTYQLDSYEKTPNSDYESIT